MVHTFVSDREDFVRQQVCEPFKRYLRSSIHLIKHYASSFPAFTSSPNDTDSSGDNSLDFSSLSVEEQDAIVDHAFERYYEKSGLFGTPSSCQKLLNQLSDIGVTEIACLIDFGVASDCVLDNLPHLDQLRQSWDPSELPASISQLINEHNITHLQCTPSMGAMLCDDSETKESLKSLKYLMIGGEKLSGQLTDRLREVSTGKIINLYGPTETTIWSTSQAVENTGEPGIGMPIVNTNLYITDEKLRLVPQGVAGELLIGGAGVSQGYFNNKALTGIRFMRNPFGEKHSDRVYRTGDLVRYDGSSVFYLGRIDQQFKLLGHRIEAGEIEQAVLKTGLVTHSCVLLDNDERLIAFVTTNNAYAGLESDITNAISNDLNGIMLPSRVIVLEKFPLTIRNKVDRQALVKLIANGADESCQSDKRTMPTTKLVRKSQKYGVTCLTYVKLV